MWHAIKTRSSVIAFVHSLVPTAEFAVEVADSVPGWFDWPRTFLIAGWNWVLLLSPDFDTCPCRARPPITRPSSAVPARQVRCAWSGFAVRHSCVETRAQSSYPDRLYCLTKKQIACAVIFLDWISSNYFLFGAPKLLHQGNLFILVNYWFIRQQAFLRPPPNCSFRLWMLTVFIQVLYFHQKAFNFAPLDFQLVSSTIADRRLRHLYFCLGQEHHELRLAHQLLPGFVCSKSHLPVIEIESVPRLSFGQSHF